ncbi:hypothetical protein BZA05DRAFT_402911 [Tricharina praecox]|uniref:uncharacterized protein n=1 Tax=Tricharina praecox TaxID=43433 RepID=UPI0022204CC5|nr:uncharacterized protein BZA05DRAFT_402911 [Tricharina praecox]KAI5848846.1 hypothetical protein BZA05DRAFT_402911 [Tricharina praecox]
MSLGFAILTMVIRISGNTCAGGSHIPYYSHINSRYRPSVECMHAPSRSGGAAGADAGTYRTKREGGRLLGAEWSIPHDEEEEKLCGAAELDGREGRHHSPYQIIRSGGERNHP